MPRKQLGDGTYVEMEGEELAQYEAESAADLAMFNARNAERARRQAIKADAFITDIEDQMRGKTLAEVKTIGDNMTVGLDPALAKFIKYLLAKAVMGIE